MRFEEIGERTTITLDMDGLHVLALICKAAVECGECGLEAESFYAAFTAATLIARVHGDIGEPTRAHMAAIHARTKAGKM
jgi:hypothetical protein